MVIVCGWCGKPTANRDRCTTCGHAGPARPWEQRGEVPPTVSVSPGRPALTEPEIRRRLASMGSGATDEQLADHFEVDPRTVRRWRQKVSG